MKMNRRGFMLLLVAQTIVIVFIFKLMPQHNWSVWMSPNQGKESSQRNETFQSFPLRQKHSNTSVDVAKPPKASNETFQKFTQWHQQSNIIMTDELKKTYTYLIESMPNNSVDCRALFNGSENELQNAKMLVKATPKRNQEEQADVLIRRTTDCKIYVETHGYIMSGMTEKEVNFPIAYSIIMYTATLQVEHLLRAIYRPQNIYCIHLDAKSSNATFSAIQGIAKCFPNVFLLEPRISVVWGEISVLEVELMCMKELLERNRFWKYFINLTGQEFPLKTNSEIVEILTAFNGSNSVSGAHQTIWRFRKRYVNAGPQPMSPVIGPLHIVVNRAFVQFALHDARAKRLYNWARNTSFPDEVFFSSLNLNPALQIPGSYRYIDLKAPSEIFINRFKVWFSACKGKKLRFICLLGVDYLPELSIAPQLFANKFIWNDDNLSLHCLDQLLHNRTREALTGQSIFNASWYSTLDFVVNKL